MLSSCARTTTPLRTPVILTDAQFEDMTRKGAFAQVGRVELRCGVVVAMSPVHIKHASAHMALLHAIDRAVAVKASCLAVVSVISIRIGAGFQPTAGAGLGEYWVADVAGRILHRCSTPIGQALAARVAFRFGEAFGAVSLPLRVDTQGLERPTLQPPPAHR